MNFPKTLLFVGLATFLSLEAFSQNSQDEKAIHDLIQNSFDDLFSGLDPSSIENYYTQDFILLELGEVWDNKMIGDYLVEVSQSDDIPKRVNRFDFIKTVIDGDRAWVAYHNYATVTRKGGDIKEREWLESATAIKTPKGWRLEMLHSTRIENE